MLIHRKYLILLLLSGPAIILPGAIYGQNPDDLKRSIEWAAEVKTESSTNTCHYTPLFGEGDKDAANLRGIKRFGILILDPQGQGNKSKLKAEELVCYVLEGTGLLQYNNHTIPISPNDFFYIPDGTKYGFSNPREQPLKLIIMGYKIPQGTSYDVPERPLIASANEVPFQVLGQHGPTTKFQLLLGTTKSERDRLAAAVRVNSLFVMDFDVGGTNIPHRHEREEEIYYLLQGDGEIVAGETAEGEEVRIPAKQGDAFYFSNGTLVGFYSNTKEGETHARILAIRSRLE